MARKYSVKKNSDGTFRLIKNNIEADKNAPVPALALAQALIKKKMGKQTNEK